MREADNLTSFMCRMSWKSGSLNLLETLWATPGLLRDCFTFTDILHLTLCSQKVHSLKVSA